MGIGRLQKGGQSFRMSYGAGNFTKQFNKETKHGELQNLRDNKKTILKVVDKYKNYIRRNVLGRKLQKKAYLEITKEEGNKLTIGDKRDIKKVLKHFSEKDSTENKPEPVSVINRAKAEDPNNSASDSLVKKVGTRFVMNREIDDQNIQNNRISQVTASPITIQKSDNPIDYHALGLIKKENIVSKRINIQRAETPVIPEPANKVEDFERKESILAASPLKNVAKAVDVEKAETPVIPKAASVEKAENPVIPEPANQAEDFERRESILAASPLKNVAKPVDVEKAETPVIPKAAGVEKAEKPVAPKPIKVEKKESPVAPQSETPVDYRALGLIRRKPTPLKPRLINIQKAENPVIPEPANKVEDFERKESILAALPIKNVAKAVDVKKAEAPIVQQPINIEKTETPIVPKSASVEKAEKPVVPEPIKVEKKESPVVPQSETPVAPPPIEVKKKIIIQRAETPVIPEPANKVEDFERKESILAASPIKNVAKPVDVEKAETPVVQQSINIEKTETPIPLQREAPTPSKENNPIDYHALGLIKKKTTPLKPKPIVPQPIKVENIKKVERPVVPPPIEVKKKIIIQRAENPVTPETVKAEKKESPITPQFVSPIKVEKKIDVQKAETPIIPKPVSVEKAETPITPETVKAEKKETPITPQNETPVVPPPIEVKKKIIIQRAENPAENNLAPKAVKAKKKENLVAHESIIFDKPINIKKTENPAEKPIAPEHINIQKAEAQPDKDIPNIADLKEPSPDNIPSPDNNISPSKEEVRTNRGDAVRAKINYEHALNLGGSEAAQEIQKKAFEKMNNIDNSSNN